MKPRLLIIVESDPRHSGRAAEALRIASGVSVWQRADLTLYLRGEAIRLLGEDVENIIDGRDLAQYWPLLMENKRPIYAEAQSARLRELAKSPVRFTELDDAGLAQLAARQNSVLRF